MLTIKFKSMIISILVFLFTYITFNLIKGKRSITATDRLEKKSSQLELNHNKALQQLRRLELRIKLIKHALTTIEKKISLEKFSKHLGSDIIIEELIKHGHLAKDKTYLALYYEQDKKTKKRLL